ncbi:hypothetical protein DM02DRAFT_302045 [Periconia macrospinosa]|uniref:Uncharacterized protein n=1 Tax=Periconia macrospinosa TaxID=97972 RepID=A0A2V1DX45_9PLEO|nr:hypothetical protein DM02DRAFT_302045 [Periconia macrospinosa]
MWLRVCLSVFVTRDVARPGDDGLLACLLACCVPCHLRYCYGYWPPRPCTSKHLHGDPYHLCYTPRFPLRHVLRRRSQRPAATYMV